MSLRIDNDPFRSFDGTVKFISKTKQSKVPVQKAPVLVATVNGVDYIIGYQSSTQLVKTNTHTDLIGSVGTQVNTLYSQFTVGTSVSAQTDSNKVLSFSHGQSFYIGQIFTSGSDTIAPFNEEDFWQNTNSAYTTAPLAPANTGFFVMQSGGSKIYQNDSGTLIESAGHRVNIGIPDTKIFSHGVWSGSSLRVETVEDLLLTVASGTAADVSGTGDKVANEYMVYNYTDDTAIRMDSGAVTVENYDVAGTSSSIPTGQVVWDNDGVLITAHNDKGVVIQVDGTIITVSGSGVVITGNMVHNGDLTVTGNLIVSGTSDMTGKLTSTGGADLA